MANKKLANNFILLVEGKDDLFVLSELLKHHQVPENFLIKNKEGIEKLLDTLDVELIAGSLERLAIVVDADIAPEKRWTQIRNILTASGYTNAPLVIGMSGTIFEQQGKRIGIWIMPDNSAAGMLEDFVRLLTPPGDDLLLFAEECVDEVMVRDRRFPVSHRSKAIIHTWLSWQKEPGTPLGLAIKNRELNASSPTVQPLLEWLSQMFTSP